MHPVTIKDQPPLRVGISSCLLGLNVRYNGGHKYSLLCVEQLGPHVELIGFCPEEAAGFGTPRPPMQLVGTADCPALLQVDNPGPDLRPQLEAGLHAELDKFASLDGFILMPRSPSCGLYAVNLYNSAGQLQQEQTRGIFASAFCKRYPQLPVEQEDRLHAPGALHDFIRRMQAYRNDKRTKAATLPLL